MSELLYSNIQTTRHDYESDVEDLAYDSASNGSPDSDGWSLSTSSGFSQETDYGSSKTRLTKFQLFEKISRERRAKFYFESFERRTYEDDDNAEACTDHVASVESLEKSPRRLRWINVKEVHEKGFYHQNHPHLKFYEALFEVLTFVASFTFRLEFFVKHFAQNSAIQSRLDAASRGELFSNILHVYAKEKRLFRSLKDEFLQDIFMESFVERVTEFLNHPETTRQYVEYCRNFPRQRRAFRRLKRNKNLESILMQLESEAALLLETQGLFFGRSFDSYLDLPLKHVASYRLLLENVAKECPVDAPDCRRRVEAAVYLARNLGEAANEAKAEWDRSRTTRKLKEKLNWPSSMSSAKLFFDSLTDAEIWFEDSVSFTLEKESDWSDSSTPPAPYSLSPAPPRHPPAEEIEREQSHSNLAGRFPSLFRSTSEGCRTRLLFHLGQYLMISKKESVRGRLKVTEFAPLREVNVLCDEVDRNFESLQSQDEIRFKILICKNHEGRWKEYDFLGHPSEVFRWKTLLSFYDEGENGEIRYRSHMMPSFRVVSDFDPEFADQLQVRVGQSVRLRRIRSDGWAEGILQRKESESTQRGWVPRTCISLEMSSVTDAAKRRSLRSIGEDERILHRLIVQDEETYDSAWPASSIYAGGENSPDVAVECSQGSTEDSPAGAGCFPDAAAGCDRASVSKESKLRVGFVTRKKGVRNVKPAATPIHVKSDSYF